MVLNESGHNRSPEEIERELEQSRLQISRTIDALQHKITPGQLASDAYGYMRGSGTEFARNLGTAAKNNPVPIALMSIGLAWLMMGGGGTASYLQGGPSRRGAGEAGEGEGSLEYAADTAGEYARSAGDYATSAGRATADAAGRAGRQVSDMASGASERVRRMADDVRDLASEWSEGASEYAGEARSRMQRAGGTLQDQAMQMRDSASSLLREQPLVVGALGLAVGALLGAMIPLSQRENEMMGETRDQLVDQAKDMGQQALDQAAESAKNVASTAAGAAREEADRRGPAGAGSGSESGNRQSGQSSTEQSAAGSRTT